LISVAATTSRERQESINELLDEIGRDYSATAVQMNTVTVKAPAVQLRNFVRSLTQNDDAESIAIKRKKSKRCHSFTWTKNRLSVEVIRVRSSHSEDRKF